MRVKRTLYPVDRKDRDGNYRLFVQPARWRVEKVGWGEWKAKPNPVEPTFGNRIFLPNLRND